MVKVNIKTYPYIPNKEAAFFWAHTAGGDAEVGSCDRKSLNYSKDEALWPVGIG